MKKNAQLGTAIWITSDGDFIKTDNHLQKLVDDNFDLDLFKQKILEFIQENYINEADILEMESEHPYNPHEPGAPQIASPNILAELNYLQEISPLQIGEISTIINKLNILEAHDAAEFIQELIPYVSQEGFENVILHDEQPYHFAFKRGDIRVRLFPGSFVAELDASKLNRDTADEIVNSFFRLTGGNPKNIPREFGIDLINFSGKEPKVKNYTYSTMEDFFEGLMRLTKSSFNKRVAFIHTLLRLSRVFYQKVIESCEKQNFVKVY